METVNKFGHSICMWNMSKSGCQNKFKKKIHILSTT